MSATLVSRQFCKATMAIRVPLCKSQSSFFQEAEQSVKLMIDSVAAAELDTVRKRHKEVLQVIIAMSILYLILNSLYFAGKQ